jgi:hypothetical protein
MRHNKSVPYQPAQDELFVNDDNDTITAERIGCNKRSIIRWRSSGRIPLMWVDPICIAYGTHPRLVWGPTWEADLDDD